MVDQAAMNSKRNKGELIVVCGAKGGIGKTLISINLAIALQKNRKQVALWDGDFQFGDVDISLNLQPTFTMEEVIESMDSLDQYSLESLMTVHESGVAVLPAPRRPEFADLVTPAILTKTLNLLLERYERVVVDTGAGITEQSLSLLEQADQILLVTTSGLSPVKHTKSILEIFDALELRERVRVVINRSTMESMAPIEKILETLQIDTAYTVPNNFSVAHASLDEGRPLTLYKSKSDVARAIFKMAETMETGAPIDPIVPPKTSFFKKHSLKH
ncbi:P-loop NTPase [Pullulanibacillus sp. KACC 23026]|uniref:AAA family ATPase n=1 Tax=Pullulanibacillus sp. KACC 23026 TaxID=3028315 RepID=UPI0023AF4789|nr:P-loop NTPase [Pullulanibacillus sp. KACC 23026]WEG13581.1 P-loop NTPase [Pullulanibacillus sp. KACC 23026]